MKNRLLFMIAITLIVAARATAAKDMTDTEALDALHLSSPVSVDEIKLRYKALVKRLHPDVNGGDRAAEEELKKINAAYTYFKNKWIAGDNNQSEPKKESPKSEPPRPEHPKWDPRGKAENTARAKSPEAAARTVAQKPVSEKGLGLSPAEADLWVPEAARHIRDGSFRTWIQSFIPAFSVASESPERLGLGYSREFSIHWAIQRANKFTPEKVQDWIKTYQSALLLARTPLEKAGYGARPENAREFALERAKVFSSAQFEDWKQKYQKIVRAGYDRPLADKMATELSADEIDRKLASPRAQPASKNPNCVRRVLDLLI